MIKWLKKNKNTIIISLIFFLFGLFPIIHWLTPSNEILIYHASVQQIDEFQITKLLSNMNNFDNMHIFLTCEQGIFWITYNTKIMGHITKLSPEAIPNVGLIDCPECTIYSTVIYNNKNRTIRDIKIKVNLGRNDYAINENWSDNIRITNENRLEGRASFQIEIDELKGYEEKFLVWSSKEYNNVSFDCDFPKQKCTIKQQEIAVPISYNARWNTFTMLNHLGVDYSNLNITTNYIREFLLDKKKKIFVEDDNTVGYRYLSPDSGCSNQLQIQNPLDTLKYS